MMILLLNSTEDEDQSGTGYVVEQHVYCGTFSPGNALPRVACKLLLALCINNSYYEHMICKYQSEANGKCVLTSCPRSLHGVL